MSSLVRTPAQIPAIYGYFRGENPDVDLYTKFILAPIKFTVGSDGVNAIQGTNVYFNTYNDVVQFLGDPVGHGNNSIAISNGEFFRDMGKTYTLYVKQYVNNAYVNNLNAYIHVVTLTKVQKYLKTGEVSEGVTGTPISTANPPAAGSAYETGYVVTWSSNPSTYLNGGVPVSVVRTGYE